MKRTRGHVAPVSAVAVSPDGRVYASGSYDRRILLWDGDSGGILGEITGHTSLINGIDWSHDGTHLASASSDHTARVWHALTGREVARLVGHTDDVNTVRWSPDGSRIATASFDGTVRVWSRSGACLLVAGHHRSDVNGVAWFPDGSRLAAASDDGTVSVFDAEDGRIRRILEGHGDWVDQVAVHPDGLVLASASQDGTVGIWDVASGWRIARLGASTCVVKDVAWSADGSCLAASSYDGRVRVYRNGSFKGVREYAAEGLWNRTLAFAGDAIVTGSFGGGPVRLGDEGVRRFGPPTTPGLNGFALSPDRGRAVVCSDDGRLYEVDLSRREVQGVLGSHDAAVLCAAFSPDGRYVASGSWDRTVRIWDTRLRRCVASWGDFGEPINSLAFDATGRRVWLGTFNGDVAVWEIEAGTLAVAGSHEGSVKQLARTRDGVVSVGRDGTVRSWTEGESSCFRAGHTILNGVAPSAKGDRIATVSRRNGIELWDPRGTPLSSFGSHPCSAKTVAWSSDERMIAAGYYDGHVALWDPATRMARVDRVSDSSVSQVAFGADVLLVSTWDAVGSLLLLDPHSGASESIEVGA